MSTCTMGDSLETVATLCTCNLQITMRKLAYVVMSVTSRLAEATVWDLKENGHQPGHRS